MSGKAVTRADLSQAVHEEVGLSRQESARLVDEVFEKMRESLREGEGVKIASFGSFEVRWRRGGVGRNPKTGEEYAIEPRAVVVFRPSAALLSALNDEENR